MLTEDADSLHTYAQKAAPFSSRCTAFTCFDPECCQQVDCSIRKRFSVFVSCTADTNRLTTLSLQR